MGWFGDKEAHAKYEAIKDEYRAVKKKITQCNAEAWQAATIGNAASAPKFEYLVLEDVEPGVLSQHGLDGWELVNFASYTVGFGLGGNSSMKVHLRYVFKRPMQPLSEEARSAFANLENLLARKAELVAEIEARGHVAE